MRHFFFQEHTGRVFRLQFDDFQIVSSSHDDTILIWDFLDASPGVPHAPVEVQMPMPNLDGEHRHANDSDNGTSEYF